MSAPSPKIEDWTRWLLSASKEEMRRELIRIYTANIDDIGGDVACKIMSYDDAHLEAEHLGFESLTEALEELDRLRARASMSHGEKQ